MAVNLSFSTDPKGSCLVVPSPLPSKAQVSEKQQLFSAWQVMENWGSSFHTSHWHFCYLAQADYAMDSVTRGPESVLSAGDKYVAVTAFCDDD